MSDGKSPAEPDLLTARQVRELTGVSESQLHEWAVARDTGVGRDGPPHVRLSARRRRWDRQDVLDWINSVKAK